MLPLLLKACPAVGRQTRTLKSELKVGASSMFTHGTAHLRSITEPVMCDQSVRLSGTLT